METLITNLSALWKVVGTAVLLGVGLPVIFAVGVRWWAAAEAVAVDGSAGKRNYPALIGAYLCFTLIIAAIMVGILYTAKAFIAVRFGIHLFGQS